jgi:two-component system, OmpR family, response regulator
MPLRIELWLVKRALRCAYSFAIPAASLGFQRPISSSDIKKAVWIDRGPPLRCQAVALLHSWTLSWVLHHAEALRKSRLTLVTLGVWVGLAASLRRYGSSWAHVLRVLRMADNRLARNDRTTGGYHDRVRRIGDAHLKVPLTGSEERGGVRIVIDDHNMGPVDSLAAYILRSLSLKCRSMISGPHILIVDDEHDIRILLTRYIEQHGFRVTAVRDAREARRAWAQAAFQLVVLDLRLPGESGLEVLGWLRQQSDIPIVMLSAMGEDGHRIVGLELGADDYVAKPFNPRELVARIRNVIRRADDRGIGSTIGGTSCDRLRFAGWELDVAIRQITTPEGSEVVLTLTECALLQVLLTHANRVVNRDTLVDLLHGRQSYSFNRTIDVAVSRLRRKLGDPGARSGLIKTVRGNGYVLAATVERR